MEKKNEYYQKNKEKLKAYSKEYNKKNKEKIKEYYLEYNKKNKEKYNEYQNEYQKEYYQKNKEKIKAYKLKSKEKIKEYRRDKYKNNIDFRLIQIVRTRINKALKGNKTKHTIEHLGCGIQHYKTYLKLQFDSNMTWENYGSYWEIDHTHPLSKGGSFHYTNTQPLTVTENRKKSNKL